MRDSECALKANIEPATSPAVQSRVQRRTTKVIVQALSAKPATSTTLYARTIGAPIQRSGIAMTLWTIIGSEYASVYRSG